MSTDEHQDPNLPEDEPENETLENDDSDESLRSVEVSMERVESLLANGEIVEDHGRLRWSSNYTMLISVQDDDLQSLAIYKPQKGERPLWDFPDGTLCKREVAAYVVSHELGWDIVAPTVLREGPLGVGAVQLFIEHDPEITYFQLSDDFIPQLQRFALFDYITNNTDRKGGHCLLDNQGKLWGIDHGICFHQHPKLRTVIWDFAGEAVSDELLNDLSQLCGVLNDLDAPFRQRMQELLNPVEIQAFEMRLNRLLNHRQFPKPGPGPNYPWPAV